MKVKIELFGASRDFSDKNSLDFEVENNSTIKDIRNKIIKYLDKKFNGNENYKKIVNSSAFCSADNNIISDNYKITNNEKIAKSRIKLGLLLNEYGEKNNLKVSDEEVKAEIQKQIKGMPGQEKMALDYYQKNPSASQSLKGSIYEEKIITLIKSKIKLTTKNLTTMEAEKIISDFNKPKLDKSKAENKAKSKKISKK